MKNILTTMAAVSALGLAAPAASQPWSGNRAQSDALQSQIEDGLRSGAISQREAQPLRDSLGRLVLLESRYAPNGYNGRENSVMRQRTALLRRQIAAAERNSSRHRPGWQDQDDDERRAGWDDRSGHEAERKDRDAERRRQARWSDSSGDRAAAPDRDDIERYARWNDGADQRKPLGGGSDRLDDRFDRSNRGDRFAGDVRVGQAVSARMTELPERYRARFADDERVYYRYDDRRIYRVDRRNGLVVAMLDLVD